MREASRRRSATSTRQQHHQMVSHLEMLLLTVWGIVGRLAGERMSSGCYCCAARPQLPYVPDGQAVVGTAGEQHVLLSWLDLQTPSEEHAAVPLLVRLVRALHRLLSAELTHLMA